MTIMFKFVSFQVTLPFILLRFRDMRMYHIFYGFVIQPVKECTIQFLCTDLSLQLWHIFRRLRTVPTNTEVFL